MGLGKKRWSGYDGLAPIRVPRSWPRLSSQLSSTSYEIRVGALSRTFANAYFMSGFESLASLLYKFPVQRVTCCFDGEPSSEDSENRHELAHHGAWSNARAAGVVPCCQDGE